MKTNSKKTLFNLCFCGIMIALSTALSFVVLFKLPLEGSVTLCSMLPIMLISYFLGLKWGIVSALINSLIQMFISLGAVMGFGVSMPVVISCLLLDYVLAYTSVGITGIFRKNDCSLKQQSVRFIAGMIVAVLLRFFWHFLSGVVLFGEFAAFKPEWLYSICYNGSFLGCDLALCIVVGSLCFISMKKIFDKMQ